MEHRWNKRYPVVSDVTLFHHTHPATHAKTLNVGPVGMFIPAGHIVYRRNTMLDVEFTVTSSWSQRAPRCFRLPAIVIHNSDNGMGLMFRESTTDALEAWQSLSRGSTPTYNHASAWV